MALAVHQLQSQNAHGRRILSIRDAWMGRRQRAWARVVPCPRGARVREETPQRDVEGAMERTNANGRTGLRTDNAHTLDRAKPVRLPGAIFLPENSAERKTVVRGRVKMAWA